MTKHTNPNGTIVRVRLGDNVHLGDDVRLGDNVTLGDDVTLGSFASLGNSVSLGDDVSLGNSVRLGDGVRLGDDVSLARHLYWCAGRDSRGYEMLGWIGIDDALQRPIANRPYDPVAALMVTAGCRTFSLAEAYAHWGAAYTGDRSIGDDMLRKLDYLRLCAASHYDSLP